MIVLIGNQKGGAGKSTLTLMLANFLTSQKYTGVTVVDMDYQQSLSQKFQRTKVLENEEPYQIVPASLEQFPDMMDLFAENEQDLILIDLPGKLDDDGLIPVFQSADLVICPFSYDEFSFESTILFAVVLNKINPEVDIAFVPNRVKAKVKYETQRDVDEQLRNFGTVTAPVPDRIDFSRVSTAVTPESVQPVINPIMEQLYLTYFSFLTDGVEIDPDLEDEYEAN